jgi:hypothetical protein
MVPNPAKGTPDVIQIIAKGIIAKNENPDKKIPNIVISLSGL